jgi:hypothetical protein
VGEVHRGRTAGHAGPGELRCDADARRLGLALSTTLQGGLLLTQIRRDTWALEVALDAMLDHVESFLAPV